MIYQSEGKRMTYLTKQNFYNVMVLEILRALHYRSKQLEFGSGLVE